MKKTREANALQIMKTGGQEAFVVKGRGKGGGGMQAQTNPGRATPGLPTGGVEEASTSTRRRTFLTMLDFHSGTLTGCFSPRLSLADWGLSVSTCGRVGRSEQEEAGRWEVVLDRWTTVEGGDKLGWDGLARWQELV